MDKYSFLWNYSGKDNYEFRIFLALLNREWHSYKLSKEFQRINQEKGKEIFATNLTFPNKMSEIVKKMREREILITVKKPEKITSPHILTSNKKILTEPIKEYNPDSEKEYDMNRAVDIVISLINDYNLAFLINIKEIASLLAYLQWSTFFDQKLNEKSNFRIMNKFATELTNGFFDKSVEIIQREIKPNVSNDTYKKIKDGFYDYHAFYLDWITLSYTIKKTKKTKIKGDTNVVDAYQKLMSFKKAKKYWLKRGKGIQNFLFP